MAFSEEASVVVVVFLSVHLQFTHSSSSVHCSCALNARKCIPLLDSTVCCNRNWRQTARAHESGGCCANQAQGQRSHGAVGVPGSHRDVATLRRSGTARSVRPLRAGLCNDCLRGCEPLHASALLGPDRGAPFIYSPAGHERGLRHPRESESGLPFAVLTLAKGGSALRS